jgi:hypothetical protein
LFAEHINWHFSGNKDKQGNANPVPALNQLIKSTDFTTVFMQKLADSRFITGEVYTDMAQGNHTFSMALLFIAQYLHDGPGFTALSATSFQSSLSRQVLTQWASELVNVPEINVNKLFSFITHVASGVLLPDTTAAPMEVNVGIIGQESSKIATGGAVGAGVAFPVGALSRTILDSVFQPAVNSALRSPAASTTLNAAAITGGISNKLTAPLQSKLDELTLSDIVEYQTIAMANQAQWNGMGDRWLKAVSQAANAQTQSSRTENNDFGHGFLQGFSFGIAGGSVRVPSSL